MKNNIFFYATSELSQDAFICWAINWFNVPEKPRLQQMAKDILFKLTDLNDIKSVDVYHQYSKTIKKKTEEKEVNLAVKIDVLLIVNNSIPVIIEDKTFTGEHDAQINRYVEGLKEIVDRSEDKKTLEINQIKYPIDMSRAITVFWKTGYHYDADRAVKATKKLNYEDVIQLLEPYKGENDILDDYLQKIHADKEWYDVHGKYWEYDSVDDRSDWNLNVAKHQIAQYFLMREIFPEDGWEKNNGEKVHPAKVTHGTSYGRPWSEMWIKDGTYSDGRTFETFWRIDTDNGGPYLSLRFYECNYKKGESDRHANLYSRMKEIVKEIVVRDLKEISWEKAEPGNKQNCKEAALFHLHFSKDMRDNWKQRKTELIKEIRLLSDRFTGRAPETF